ADVERHPKAVARRIRKAALEVLGGRERNRMDEQVELPAEDLARLGDDTFDVVVRANVASGHVRRVDGPSELTDACLDSLALVGEGELRPAVGEPLRYCPRDRALVRNPENEPALAAEIGHGGRV